MQRLDHNPGALALCLLAGSIPGAAACLVHYASQPDWWPGFQHVGVVAACGVGLVIAVQARLRWWLWPLGALVGAGAGWLDLRAFEWAFGELDWSLEGASLLPVWGLVLGLWAGLVCPPSWPRTALTPWRVAGSDLVARWAWAAFVESDGAAEASDAWGEAMWLLASQTYLVPALVATACAAAWPLPAAEPAAEPALAEVG